MIAEPYTARHCAACDTWIYCADGPFAEGDPTKTLADADHWEQHHATGDTSRRMGFPYMEWNETPIEIADVYRLPPPTVELPADPSFRMVHKFTDDGEHVESYRIDADGQRITR